MAETWNYFETVAYNNESKSAKKRKTKLPSTIPDNLMRLEEAAAAAAAAAAADPEPVQVSSDYLTADSGSSSTANNAGNMNNNKDGMAATVMTTSSRVNLHDQSMSTTLLQQLVNNKIKFGTLMAANNDEYPASVERKIMLQKVNFVTNDLQVKYPNMQWQQVGPAAVGDQVRQDDSYQFMMSLLPYLQNVPLHRKMAVRQKLQNVFVDEQERHNASSWNYKNFANAVATATTATTAVYQAPIPATRPPPPPYNSYSHDFIYSAPQVPKSDVGVRPHDRQMQRTDYSAVMYGKSSSSNYNLGSYAPGVVNNQMVAAGMNSKPQLSYSMESYAAGATVNDQTATAVAGGLQQQMQSSQQMQQSSQQMQQSSQQMQQSSQQTWSYGLHNNII